MDLFAIATYIGVFVLGCTVSFAFFALWACLRVGDEDDDDWELLEELDG